MADEYPIGFCQCGCGQRTKLADRNDRKRGTVKGQPRKYLEEHKGHGAKKNATHGLSDTRAHRIWVQMRRRCRDPKHYNWPNYGGRGISVCARWESFEAFLQDMGNPPPGTSIDRIDVNGDYAAANCRWATSKTQTRNRRNNRPLSFNGETKPFSAWCEEYNLDFCTLRNRLERGWDIQRALTQPIDLRRTRIRSRHAV